MKRTAMQHTKLKRLVRALKVPQYAAVGILESLWHLTAREAPEGNIGKLSNEDIAAWIDWDGTADSLIEGLVTAGWLDEVIESRLVVHDWHEHADDATKKAIDRQRKKDSDNGGNVQTKPDKTRLPEPLPLPLPEPVKNKQKPSRAASDPRHVPFKLACEIYAKHKGVTFVWDGGEAKILASLLAASPDLTLGIFQQCLNHRAKSQVPHGERPREWLGTILKYQEGPLDQYGKPQGASNGTFKGKSGHSVDAATRAIQIFEDRAASERVRDSEAGEAGHGGLPSLRDGSGELRTDGHRDGIEPLVIEASR